MLVFQVCKTTIDNGSNFVKAFLVHGATSLSTSEAEAEVVGNEEEGDDEDLDPIELSDILGLSQRTEIPEQDDVVLPQHERCAAHSLNLVASKDALKALENRAYKNAHSACKQKLRRLLTKQNKSTRVAEDIHDILDVYLITPNETRWNAEYDADQQVGKKNIENSNQIKITLFFCYR